MVVEIIGFAAAFTSTIALLPQIVKTLRTRSATDLSFLMLANFLLTSVLWLAYGLMIDATAVWAGNLIMTLFSIMMLGLKARFDHGEV
ncbi:MAG: SemiSWEET family transporter [Myxococcota bacterium]